MKAFGRTPAFHAQNGTILSGSIAEAGLLRLGAGDQWVLTRARSTANPLLILLHGGPGFSDVGLFRDFNAQLEEHFIVVNWDQRGMRRSLDRAMAELVRPMYVGT
jgi:pimeloyl-ACP methyl ester carboxylesterase